MAARLAAFPGLAKPFLPRFLPLCLLALLLPACSGLDSTVGGGSIQAGQEGFVRGFLGGVVAEEPRAALVARNMLSAGGSAADAAAAAGFTLAVTLPSRAGLGGGGACLVFNPRRNATEALVFMPGARDGVAGADRPAAVPMLARGLFALHARAGRRPFEEVIVPAEQGARLGIEISRALATDIAAVAGPLMADPAAAAIFGGAGGQPLGIGAQLVQGELGATLGTMRTAGVGDLHQGGLARRLEETSVPAGGGLSVPVLRAAVPQVLAPLQMTVGNDLLSFLPTPADGGLAAMASLAALQAGAVPAAAMARGVAVSRAWRQGGGEPAALLAAEAPADAAWPLLPASTSLVVVDREGMAVACAFTMNNLFGTGRVAPGMGILLAAAPGLGQVQPPLLSAAIAHNPNLRAFRAAVAGSGQHGAAMAVAAPLLALARGADTTAASASAPDPGRASVIACPRYLPGDAASCGAATDARGAGLAVGAADR